METKYWLIEACSPDLINGKVEVILNQLRENWNKVNIIKFETIFVPTFGYAVSIHYLAE